MIPGGKDHADEPRMCNGLADYHLHAATSPPLQMAPYLFHTWHPPSSTTRDVKNG